jgi:hypothetical protein
MAQGKVERRLSKLAAAINQKWRQTGNPGVKITARDLAIILVDAEYACTYCGTEVTALGVSFDHVVPFADGGPNTPANIGASCITCQRSKYTKSPEELEEWKTLERKCRTCGKAFRPRWADYTRGYGYYCSRTCSGKAAH